MALGFILAICVGAILPVDAFLGGLYANIYLKEEEHIENEELWWEAMYICIGFLSGAVAIFVLSYLQQYLLLTAAHRIAGRIRKEFIKAVLRQDAAWLDANSAGTITTTLNENVAQIEDGLGDKIGMLARERRCSSPVW